MTVARWIAYFFWLAMVLVAVFAATLGLAQMLFGINTGCPYGPTSNTTEEYRRGVALVLGVTGLVALVMGPRHARLSIAGYGAFAVAAVVAAAIIGDQPCPGGGSIFNPFGLD